MKNILFALFFLISGSAILYASKSGDADFEVVTADVLQKINTTYLDTKQIKKNYLTVTPSMTVTPSKAVDTATPTPTPSGK